MSDNDAKGQAFFERLRMIDPALFLAGLELGNDIRSPGMRHARGECLHAMLMKLQEVCRTIDFRDEIVMRPDAIFVNIDGVLFDTLSQWMYLKASGFVQHGIGPTLGKVLDERGIRPSVLVDVGASYGGVSLWLARQYPQARVLAIEPVAANREVFERNMRAQSFPTGNIKLLPLAVMDRKGTVDITSGVSTMNRVVANPVPGTETVDCDRLENIFAAEGIDEVDFIKVDIEGSEPQLADSVLKLGRRVKAWMFEFSRFAPFESYMTLVAGLLGTGFRAFEADGVTPLADMKAIEQHLKAALAPEALSMVDLWFFAK